MKIAIIGASGFVGSALSAEALERGHEVTAISRNPDMLQILHPALKKIGVDVMKFVDLRKALEGNEVVISAFNAGWTNPNIYSDFLAGSQAIQEAVKEASVSRYIVIGGAGSLEVAPGVQAVDTPGFPEEIKVAAGAARDYLNILKKEQDLEWTFFSPAFEMHRGTSGVRKGTYRTGLDNPVVDQDGRSILSVEDVAVAVLDEAENPKHIKQRFTAAY